MISFSPITETKAAINAEVVPCFPWYAVRTRSNREKLAAQALESKGYEQYLPLYRSKRQWSDRVIEIEEPLFAGYVFCRFNPKQRLPIVTTPGVVSVVSYDNEPAPIGDTEIEAIRTVLQSGFPAKPCPFLREGQRVQIKRGPLKGTEGILVKKKKECLLVVSVAMLQRSVLVDIDPESIHGIESSPK